MSPNESVVAESPTIKTSIPQLESRQAKRPKPRHPDHSSELVLVDSSVHDATWALGKIMAEPDNRSFSILSLKPQDVGISQISNVFSQKASVFDVVHIVAGRAEDQIKLGASHVDTDSLHGVAAEISNWSSYLSTRAKIMLYADSGEDQCREFTETLEWLTEVPSRVVLRHECKS